MHHLRTIVALSLVPGRVRFLLAARLRDRGVDVRDLVRHGHTGLLGLLEAFAPDVGPPDTRTALARVLEGEADQALERGARAGVRACVWGDRDYPGPLAHIPDPPLVLWSRGIAAPFDGPAVAIVGARAATSGSLALARTLARDLASAGVVIVSGLARGVDAAAHAGALEAGPTVAVLGSGADVVYPAEHEALAARIAVAGGTILSEFPPGTSPQPHHFPLRNRLISGLCLGVVVIEAAEKSGSLITARYALEQGRDVMAVPGPVLSGRNRGAHALLRDGARLVESAADVLDEIGLRFVPAMEPGRAGQDADPVLACMPRGDPVDLDVLASASGIVPAALLARLTELELHGLVAREPGGRFVRL